MRRGTYFKAVLESVGVDLGKTCSERVRNDFLDLGHQVALHVKVELGTLA